MSGFTGNFEKDLEPFCRSSGVVGSEDCPADVKVVVKLLLISLVPRHGPDVAGRGFSVSSRELTLRDLNRWIWMFIRKVEVDWLLRVVGVVDCLSGGV